MTDKKFTLENPPKIEENVKQQIDSMTMEEMLRRIRFDPPGSRYFVGDVGDYMMLAFAKKKKDVGPEEFTRISKKIGW